MNSYKYTNAFQKPFEILDWISYYKLKTLFVFAIYSAVLALKDIFSFFFVRHFELPSLS